MNPLCQICGKGKIVLMAAGKKAYPTNLPEDYLIRTCTSCGEQFLNQSEARKLDSALERIKNE